MSPSAFDGYLPNRYDDWHCPKCGSEAVMEPGRLKGRPVGIGLRLACVACHHEGETREFRSRGRYHDRVDTAKGSRRHMTIKVGDMVTWSSAANPNAIGFAGCKVLELGEAEDGRQAARLDCGRFGEACAAVDDLIVEDEGP